MVRDKNMLKDLFRSGLLVLLFSIAGLAQTPVPDAATWAVDTGLQYAIIPNVSSGSGTPVN
jgi:hypothetical protein